MPKKIEYNKLALTFEEQLDHLISRGLKVENRSKALQHLASINYYRLSAYWYGNHPIFNSSWQ